MTSERTENDVFKELAGGGPNKEALERELQRLLTGHALSVAWLQLREYRPDIANFCVHKAFQQMHKFRGESKFSTWFHRIVLNACSRNLHNQLRRAEIPLDQVQESGETNESAILAKLQIAKIAAGLDSADRQFLEWKLAQLNDVEISEQTGWSKANVRQRWSRLRKRILQELKR
jgi:RNA polymerase sigma-70 factor (ECF subfamily)